MVNCSECKVLKICPYKIDASVSIDLLPNYIPSPCCPMHKPDGEIDVLIEWAGSVQKKLNQLERVLKGW